MSKSYSYHDTTCTAGDQIPVFLKGSDNHKTIQNSKYRSYIILIRKASGASASNIHCQDSDTIIFDLSLPGGILINTAAVYGPNGDIDQYWKDVKSVLDTRTGNGKMILGDFNVTLDFA